MKKYFKYCIGVMTILAVFFACNQSKTDAETILKGSTTILVDETLTPIVEDQIAVFENSYNAKIKTISLSEKEAVVSLSKGVADIIILPRKLTDGEENVFKNKKIKPRVTPFAKDGIALITNNRSNDSLISVDEIVAFLKGNPSKIKGLVFDNPNSSCVNYITKLASLNELPKKGIYSFNTNEDVVKYVAENKGLIGVIGVNWISQPSSKMIEVVEKVTVLKVKSTKSNNYYYPSQEELASGNYPLARLLYIINCQGYEGLGMGFASFIAGEKGQRIILKSGLSPVKIPERNIRIRYKIEN